MRTLTVGTAGHIDHGKTALVRALTGIETDRLPDEKRRGITIDLGFAHLQLGDVVLDFVDVPGHESFVRNMLAGATGIDLAVLVVAADAGVMPQTREHLAILDLLGITRGVVALTKADLVEAEWLELVSDELRSALKPTGLAQAPIVPVSSVTGQGLDDLRAALTAVAAESTPRTADDVFRLPIDRVFTVRGTGTVVTGTVWSGRLPAEGSARILPKDLTVRTRGVHVHGAPVLEIAAGQRAAVALAGVPTELVRRGDILVDGAAWEPASILTVRLRFTADAPPMRTRQRVRFHLGTVERLGRIALLEGDELDPGAETWAQLRLEQPVAARAGDRFVIRSYSPVMTIGGGVIAEPFAIKRRLIDAQLVERLGAVLTGAPRDAVTAAVALAGVAGLPAARLPIATRFGPVVARAAASSVQEVGDRLFLREDAARVRDRLLALAESYHARHPLRQGVSREELRQALPRSVHPLLAHWALDSLSADGAVEPSGALLRVRGFAPRLTPRQETVRAEVLASLEAGGMARPTVPELPAPIRGDPDLWRIIKLLEHEEKIVALTAELYVSRTQLEAAVREVLVRLGGREGLGPADFRTLFPISRKYLIPLLEHLDGRGVTVRSGESRSVPHVQSQPHVEDAISL